MAHAFTNLKTRLNRCIGTIIELRGRGDTQDENAAIEDCIALLQRTQLQVIDRLSAGSPRPGPAPRRAAQPRFLPPAAAPVPASQFDADDDDVLPATAGPADVLEFMAAGKQGTAAQRAHGRLVVSAEWQTMTDDQRLAAVQAEVVRMTRAGDDEAEGVRF